MNQIKAVIFDLDGTIGDTLPLCIRAFRQSIEPLVGRPVSDAEIIATFGPSEEGTIAALAPAHYEKGVADYLQHYEAFHDMCPSPFEGIEELLRTLRERGVRIAMVTGKGKYSTALSLKQFGLKDYFEIIETGVPAGPRKPEGIQEVLDRFSDIPKEEIIYVGDAPSDITASRKAGIPVVAAAWAETAEPEQLKALQPDALFYSLADFATWLIARIR
ncbi:MAG TPA: HAD family hydrolase [Chitinophagaceae bacterium]|jgi:phosphoglycolate phosphatase/pyrophosphatase PpaX|nr:HAD family hydrolase [Chitinophagaceae bacterium]